MGDADDSYDFGRLEPFVEKLRQGYPLVMGNRFKGGIRRGAMPPLHRYLGNPVLSFLGRLLFGARVGDFHCGLRGFDRRAVGALDLRTSGMEFASELVVKAALAGWRVAEVPITLHPDGRGRPAHLRSWRDGWRHLRFLLLFSPRWLFLYPGLALLASGMRADHGAVFLAAARSRRRARRPQHALRFGRRLARLAALPVRAVRAGLGAERRAAAAPAGSRPAAPGADPRARPARSGSRSRPAAWSGARRRSGNGARPASERSTRAWSCATPSRRRR